MAEVIGQSTDPGNPGVLGQPMNINVPGTPAIGVKGDGGSGFPPAGGGIIIGRQAIGVLGICSDPNGTGIHGENSAGGDAGQFFGNVFVSKDLRVGGVQGDLKVSGTVSGTSSSSDGVQGQSQSPQHAGVSGTNLSGGNGVFGQSSGLDGVHGESQSPQHAGVSGINLSGGFGVWGQANGLDGVHGECDSNQHAGVSGINLSGGIGVFGQGTPAGHFLGDVEVTGDIRLLNQDCAEDFDISSTAEVEPGTVMVIDKDGALQISRDPYDKRVAGVISGAGDLRPGIILGRQPSNDKRMPIALLGKVCCKVDAEYSPIEVGDLLTSSATPGHAMRASDPLRAFGSVIGKALMPQSAGQGIITVLVALQ